MRPSFLPRLVNGPFDDPGLYVPLTFQKRALLFDLGDLSPLSAGDILKTSHIFVSHTHMDHFIGFDQLLRLLLGRDKTLYLYGPAGFIDNVAGKLQSYTWNLVKNYTEGLMLHVTEIHPQARITQQFDCCKGFAPSPRQTQSARQEIIHQEPAFHVRTTILDHRVPSLAFTIEERFHINILKAELDALALTVGPWVGKFKTLLFEKADPATPVRVPCLDQEKSPRTFALGELAAKITRITPGQKLTYVADAGYSPANQEQIITLALNTDHLFIEAAFLKQDRETAQVKYHLTAHQAGTLARKANAHQMTIFHHSPRYLDQESLLLQEAQKAFTG
jgi:ribonuclease Z